MGFGAQKRNFFFPRISERKSGEILIVLIFFSLRKREKAAWIKIDKKTYT